jgi:hypothetical protein
MAAMTERFSGSPVRAASRSTTWTHGAPAATNAILAILEKRLRP